LVLTVFILLVVLTTAGFSINIFGAEINIVSFHTIAMILTALFISRFVLSENVWHDRFSTICRDICNKRYTIFFIFFIIALIYFIIKLHSFNSLSKPKLDFTLYYQAVVNTLNGKFLYLSIFQRSYLSEHFALIIVLQVPFYFIFPSPFTLFVYHSASLAATVITAFYLSRILLKDSFFAILFAISLTTMFEFNALVTWDLHHESAYPVLLLLTFICLEKDRSWLFLICLLALWTIKEDAQFYTFAFSIGVIIYKKWWKQGLIGVSLSIVSWLLVMFVIMPNLGNPNNTTSTHFLNERWGKYGQSFWEIFVYFINNPSVIFNSIFSLGVLRILASFLFLPLLSPWISCTILPILIHTTSGFKTQAALSAYYGNPIAVMMAISFLYGLRNLISWSKHRNWNTTRIVLILILLFTFINFGNLRINPPDPNISELDKIISLIPTQVSVATQENLCHHLYKNNRIFFLVDRTDADYLLFDLSYSGWFALNSARHLVFELSKSKDYELISSFGEEKLSLIEGDYRPFKRFYLFKWLNPK